MRELVIANIVSRRHGKLDEKPVGFSLLKMRMVTPAASDAQEKRALFRHARDESRILKMAISAVNIRFPRHRRFGFKPCARYEACPLSI